MKVSDSLGSLKQLRKTPWRFQRTFRTPLKKLDLFVTAIVSAGAHETACVTIDEVVFEPKNWIDLLTRYSLPARYEKGMSVTANGHREIEELLHSAFADWVNFLFVPDPKPFVMYADHDEYATFYANNRSNLNRIVQALSSQGFDEIAEYTRHI